MSELTRLYQSQSNPGESERTRKMALLDAYYCGSQYSALPRAWDETLDDNGAPIPFRMRRPSTVLPWPALIVNTFTRALWSSGRRPVAMLKEAEPKENQDVADLIAEAQLYRVMREASRRALTVGTGVITWKLQDDRYSAEAWDVKWCTPTFKPGCFPCLEKLEYRYPFTIEENGKAITKWHREVLDATSWKVYQDVEVSAEQEPKWREDSALSVDHELGFTPAVWFTVSERSGPWDGTGIFEAMLSLFDDANYTASQAGRALHQNLDPQLTISGISDIDIQELRKGGNTWPLPPGSEAKLLESNGKYVESAEKRLDYLRKQIMDAAAVVINDPERVSGGQSGSALELLSAPMLARVSDLREDVGDCALVPLLKQMLSVRMPRRDCAVMLHWGSASPTTTEDAKAAVEAATKAVESGILSKGAAARYIAPYVGVIDPEHDQDQTEGVADALVLDSADMPSPTFQRIRKLDLAKKHLGNLATPADHASIEAELTANIHGEDYAPDARSDPGEAQTDA